MVPATDENASGSAWPRHLGMATQTQICIRLGEHFSVDGPVGIMADRAAFPQGGVFINERPGLFPVALGAGFIQPRHGQSTRRFHNVHAVRVVALNAIHFPFQHRMMLGKVKFSLHLQMTLETRLRILARVDDKLVQAAPAAQGNVFAARTVAGFAAILASHASVFQMQPRVRTGRKDPSDVCVAIGAGRVPDIGCSLNSQRYNYRAIRCGTGIDQKKECPGARRQHRSGPPA